MRSKWNAAGSRLVWSTFVIFLFIAISAGAMPLGTDGSSVDTSASKALLSGGSSDRDTSNNVAFKAAVMPDLTLGTFYATAVGPTTQLLTARIANAGTIPSEICDVAVYIGSPTGSVLDIQTVDSLSSGGSHDLLFHWDTSLGTYADAYEKAYVMVDVDDDVKESNESNNSTFLLAQVGQEGTATPSPTPTQTFTVTPTPTPTVPPTPYFITNMESVPVFENDSAHMHFWLSGEPQADVVVAVEKLSGDENLVLTEGAAITIPKGEWATQRRVSIQAQDDVDETEGTATFQIREDTSTNGLDAKQFTARELDDDGLFYVSGTIAASTTWSDTTRFYYIYPSTVIVPTGVTLTIAPGVKVRNYASDRASFQVEGALQATNASFWVTTTCHDSTYRRNAITVKEGGQVTLQGCDFYTREMGWRWGHNHMTYSAAAVEVEEGGQATIGGCQFESTNTYYFYRTPFGVMASAGSTVTIGEYGGSPTTFQGYQGGIGWSGGDNAPQIASSCTSTDDYADMYVWGEVSQNATLPAFDIRMEGDLTVKTGAELALPAGAKLYTPFTADWDGVQLVIESGAGLTANGATFESWEDALVAGTFEANDSSFKFRMYAHNDTYRDNGMNFQDGSTGVFRRCEFLGQEHSWKYAHRSYADWSAILTAEGSTQLTVEGCSFDSEGISAHPEYRPTFAIKVVGPSSVTVADDTSGGTPIPTSVTRYQYGFGWEFCDGTLDVADTTLFIDVNFYEGTFPGGDMTRNMTLPPINFAFLGAGALKPGYTLTVPEGGGLTLPSDTYTLTVDSGATLDLTRAEVLIRLPLEVSGIIEAASTTFEIYSYYYYYRGGVNLQSGAQGTFLGCSFFTSETRWVGDAGRWAAAIRANDGSQLTVDDCFFTNSPILTQYDGYQQTRHAIRSYTTQPVQITDSRFSDGYQAVHMNAIPSSYEIEGNDFHNNSAYALYNEAAETILASGNWWGDASGPSHWSNPLGRGDPISNLIAYSGMLLSDPYPYVQFLDPASGQESDNLTSAANQSNVELVGFRVQPLQTTLNQVGFRLKERAGMTDWSKLSNFRLAFDANGNGKIDTNETTTFGGTAESSADRSDLLVKFKEPFTTTSSSSAGYILLADLTGIAAGDGFTAMLQYGLCRTTPGVGLESLAGDARHRSGDYLFLAAPETGQEPDNLNIDSTQSSVELFGFQIDGDGEQVDQLTFSLSAIEGVVTRNFTSAQLVHDYNGNGLAESYEEKVGGDPTIAINGSSGTILFNSPFTIGSHYILVADFSDLNGGNRFTVGLSPANISIHSGAEVDGSVPTATHVVEEPYTLTMSPVWKRPADLGSSETLAQFELMGIQLQPSGREVNGLNLDLYNLLGIETGDISNAKVYWDKDKSGAVNTGDEVLIAAGSVSINDTTGTIQFGSSFNIPGDLIVVADFNNLESGDELTLELPAENVGIPSGYIITGSIPPLRYVVNSGLEDGSANKTKWTLTYRSPGGTLVSGRYNHAGDKVILGYDTGSAWIYDSLSNTPQLMLKDHYDKVRYAGFSSDDSAAVTVSRDGAVYIWDLDTETLRNAMFSDLLVEYAIPSPDSSKLMVITEGKGILLDIDSQTRLWEFIPGNATVRSIAYSPDGSKVLLGSSDKKVYLVDVTTGVSSPPNGVIAHNGAVTAVGFTGDGTLFMTASEDKTVQIRITATPNVITSSISLEDQEAQGAAVALDGTRVAVVSDSGSSALLRIYEPVAGSTMKLLFAVNLTSIAGQHWRGTLESITFNDDGDELLICSSGGGWAAAAAFRVEREGFLRHYGPTGEFSSWLSARPKISQDGEKIFYNTKSGLNVVPRTLGKPIMLSPNLTDERNYDISEDGSLVAWLDGGYKLRMDAISESGFTAYPSRDLGLTYSTDAPPTLSPSGRLLIIGDRLFDSQSGLEIVDYVGQDGEYVSAFSPDEKYWGFADAANGSLLTLRTNDTFGTLYNIVDTSGLGMVPYKMFYHPDGKRIACVDHQHAQTRGVQMYVNDIADPEVGNPTGLYLFKDNTDAALSKDGTLLLIGGVNHVRLFDVNTTQILRYFYPQNSSLPSMRARAVQFAKNDTEIMIAWNYNYVEIYRRSQAVDLAITPETRTLAPDQSQAFRVEIVYDDATRSDITPTAQRDPNRATLEIDPPSAATVQGNVVTVASAASGTFNVIAQYRENARNLSTEATITVGQSLLTTLRADPSKMALTPGVFRPIQYFAQYDDGYEEDVTDSVVLSSDRPDDVVLAAQSVKVNVTAMPGDIIVQGTYNDGTTQKIANTVVTVFGPKTAWERYRVTGGGYGLSGDFSSNTELLALGYSSGAVSLYDVGPTPSQYALNDVVLAHEGKVTFVDMRKDGKLVTASDDGAIKVWNLSVSSVTPESTYLHDAPILAGASYTDGWGNDSERIAFGDNLGNVGVYNVVTAVTEWLVTCHTGEVNTIAMDADTIISGGADKLVCAHLVANGTVAHEPLAFHVGPIVAVGFMGSTKFFTVSEDKTAYIISKSTYEPAKDFNYPAVPTAAAYLKSKLYVSTDSPVATWVYNSDGLLESWLPHPPEKGKVMHLLVDPDNLFLITGRMTHKTIEEMEFMGFSMGEVEKITPFSSWQFWEKGRGIYRGSLALSYPLTAAHVSSDASKIFTQSSKRTMRWIFDEVGGVTGERMMETGYFVNKSFAGMDFTEDSGTLATRVDISVFMFDTVSNLLWKTMHLPGGGPFAISPNRSYLASSDWYTRLWDIQGSSYSLIKEVPFQANGLDFIGESAFVETISPDSFQIRNTSDGLPKTTGTTAHEPERVYANKAGTRCVVISKEVQEGFIGEKTTTYFLEVFNLEGTNPTAVGPPLFLVTVTSDPFGGGEESVDFAVAVSEDTALALVGASGDRPVKLINVGADGSTIREFLPPTEGTDQNLGAAAVGFTNEDRDVMIGWAEGYVEIHRRVQPSDLSFVLEQMASAKAGGKKTVISRKVLRDTDTLYVQAGGTYSSQTIANYVNGAQLNVTSTAALSSDNESVATISGRSVVIAAGAQDGQSANVKATYSELDDTLEATVTLVVGEKPTIQGDADGDGKLDGLDLFEFSLWWQQEGAEINTRCDMDESESVTEEDLMMLIDYLDKRSE